MAHMVYSEANLKLIPEKNLELKMSCQTPFKVEGFLLHAC
jgi:hypothetical protein